MPTATRRPRLSAKSRAILKPILAACEESSRRMATYTPAQRAELERDARAQIAAGPRPTGRRYASVNALLRGESPATADRTIDGMMDQMLVENGRLTRQVEAARELISWVEPMIQENVRRHGRQVMTPFSRERMEALAAAIEAYRAAALQEAAA